MFMLVWVQLCKYPQPSLQVYYTHGSAIWYIENFKSENVSLKANFLNFIFLRGLMSTQMFSGSQEKRILFWLNRVVIGYIK